MQIGPKEIDALLAATPDTPDNHGLITSLLDLRKQAAIVKYPFTYTAVFNTAGAANNIAAGASVTVNVQIDAGSPFLIVSQTYYVNQANASTTRANLMVPDAVVLLTDTGSNRQLMDVAAPIDAIFGNGQFPYILPEPKLMQANSQLSCQITSRDAAAGFNIYLCFNGFKLYRVGQ